MLEAVASGDLTAELALLSEKDTIGLSLEKMTNNLNNMFREINTSTIQVATGSKQIADGSQSLAQGSTEQAAAVEQLSSSISEISEKTKENAVMASNASSQIVSDIAKSSGEQSDGIAQVNKGINQVQVVQQNSATAE